MKNKKIQHEKNKYPHELRAEHCEACIRAVGEDNVELLRAYHLGILDTKKRSSE